MPRNGYDTTALLTCRTDDDHTRHGQEQQQGVPHGPRATPGTATVGDQLEPEHQSGERTAADAKSPRCHAIDGLAGPIAKSPQ